MTSSDDSVSAVSDLEKVQRAIVLSLALDEPVERELDDVRHLLRKVPQTTFDEALAILVERGAISLDGPMIAATEITRHLDRTLGLISG